MIISNGGDSVDTADRTILKLLSENARVPIKQLAQEAYLSSPAASARVERLEKKGVIKGYQAMLDHEAMGFHILAFVNIAIAPERKAELIKYADSCANVLECHHVTGSHSLIFKVCFHTTMELEAFVGRLQTYGKTETQVVFSTPIEPRQIVE